MLSLPGRLFHRKAQRLKTCLLSINEAIHNMASPVAGGYEPCLCAKTPVAFSSLSANADTMPRKDLGPFYCLAAFIMSVPELEAFCVTVLRGNPRQDP